MIKAITSRYKAVFVFSFMMIIIGISSYNAIPREQAPEIRRPLIFVTTTYAGVSALNIESLITKHIENEIDGLEGLDKLKSTNKQGISLITAEFTSDTDVEIALRRVKERVDIAKPKIPQDVDEPVVRELNFSDQPFLITVFSNPNGLEILDEPADFFQDEIKSIQGVLDVHVSGKKTKELVLELDPSKLKLYGFSIDDVIKAVNKEHVTIPGGVIKNANQQFSLSITGEIENPKLFEEIIVKTDNNSIKMKALGEVKFTYKDQETNSYINGVPSISLSVTKRAGENLIRIVEDIKELIQTNKQRLPYGTKVEFPWDESIMIKDMVQDLVNNIITGFLLVVIVTFFFLGFVNAVFVSIGIPFSMLMSFIVLNMMGITLNIVVLFSLVIALGMLVDNGIVIVENIYRHRSDGKSRIQAAIDGAKEVAMPITASTATTIVAFFPIIFMPGIMGEFMSYLPITVIIVLTSSLLIALSITTTFCSRFLNVDKIAMEKMQTGGGFQSWLTAKYEKTLKTALNWPIMSLLSAFIFVFLGIVLYSSFGKAPVFFPSLDPEAATISVETPPGSSLAISDQIVKQVAEKIKEVDGSIESIQITSGKGVSDGFGGSTPESNKANIRIGFEAFLERIIPAKKTIEDLKKVYGDFTDATLKVKAQEGGPPQGHPISYEVRGDDYNIIGQISKDILAFINQHSDAFEDIDHDYEAGKPEIRIEIDREKASRYGLNTKLIASTVRNAINGGIVGKYRKGKDEYDIVVRYEESFRKSLDHLKELEIIEKGKRIPLTAVATIEPQASAGVIKRRNRRRAVNVWADFKPTFTDQKQVKSVSKDIEDKVLAYELPTGYSIVSGEGAGEQQQSQKFLIQAFQIALFLIFLILVVQFNSLSQPLIILVSVILSLGGVFWGLLLTGKIFVIIMSGIGVISLAGVVVNNAIVMIDFINIMRKKGLDLTDAVVEACKTRLRPVLLTAITTVMGLLPMALGISFDFHSMTLQTESSSSQWFDSMAWAIIFGLSFATVLTLIAVPVFFVTIERFKLFIGKLFRSLMKS